MDKIAGQKEAVVSVLQSIERFNLAYKSASSDTGFQSPIISLSYPSSASETRPLEDTNTKSYSFGAIPTRPSAKLRSKQQAK